MCDLDVTLCVLSYILLAPKAIMVDVYSGEEVSQLGPYLGLRRDGHLTQNQAMTVPMLIVPLHLKTHENITASLRRGSFRTA